MRFRAFRLLSFCGRPLPTRAALETMGSTESCLRISQLLPWAQFSHSSPPDTIITMATETADCFPLSKSSNSDTSHGAAITRIPLFQLTYRSRSLYLPFHLISPSSPSNFLSIRADTFQPLMLSPQELTVSAMQ